MGAADIRAADIRAGCQNIDRATTLVCPAADAKLAARLLESGRGEAGGGGSLAEGELSQRRDELRRHHHRWGQRIPDGFPRAFGAGLAAGKDSRPRALKVRTDEEARRVNRRRGLNLWSRTPFRTADVVQRVIISSQLVCTRTTQQRADGYEEVADAAVGRLHNRRACHLVGNVTNGIRSFQSHSCNASIKCDADECRQGVFGFRAVWFQRMIRTSQIAVIVAADEPQRQAEHFRCRA